MAPLRSVHWAQQLAEQSATGLKDRRGVLVVSVPEKTELDLVGLQANSLILSVNGMEVANMKEFFEIEAKKKRGKLKLKVWRNQVLMRFEVRFY